MHIPWILAGLAGFSTPFGRVERALRGSLDEDGSSDGQGGGPALKAARNLHSSPQRNGYMGGPVDWGTSATSITSRSIALHESKEYAAWSKVVHAEVEVGIPTGWTGKGQSNDMGRTDTAIGAEQVTASKLAVSGHVLQEKSVRVSVLVSPPRRQVYRAGDTSRSRKSYPSPNGSASVEELAAKVLELIVSPEDLFAKASVCNEGVGTAGGAANDGDEHPETIPDIARSRSEPLRLGLEWWKAPVAAHGTGYKALHGENHIWRLMCFVVF